MLTSLRVQLLTYRRSPQIFMLVAMPIVLVVVLSDALAPVLPGDNPQQSTVIGFALMFSFYAASFVADAVFQERNWGNWPRLLSLPVSPRAVVVGKIVAPVVLIVLQIILLLAFGVVAYGVQLGNVAMLGVIVVLAAVAAAALGPIFGAVGRSQVAINNLVNIVVIVLAAVGGALAPVSRLPEAIRHIAPATPHYWALKGFATATTPGGAWADLVEPIAFLLAFSAAAFAAGVAVFRFERMLDAL